MQATLVLAAVWEGKARTAELGQLCKELARRIVS